MNQMETLLFWTTVVLYALAVAAFFVGLAFGRSGATRAGLALGALGLLPHGASLGLRWVEVGHGPFSTRYEVLSANAFLLVGVYVVSAVRAKDLRGLGAVALPAALVLLGASLGTFGLQQEVPIIFKSGWLFVHIGFAKLFGATVVLAAGSATFQLVKARHPSRLAALPSAARLELHAHQFLLLSFLFLGAMIVAGSLWANQSWGRYWAWDPMETSSLLTWLVFGLVLHLRTLHGWRGSRMAGLTFVAFLFAVATVYVVTLVVPTIHDSYLVGS